MKTNKYGKFTAGGWEHRDILHHFRFYVGEVIKALADKKRIQNILVKADFPQLEMERILSHGLVRYFISINEPTSILFPSYITGIFPPYKIGRFDLWEKIIGKLVEAHDIARDEIKEKLSSLDPQVGVAHAWTYFEGFLSRYAHKKVNREITDSFERNGEYTDFIGFQYYYRKILFEFFSDPSRVYGDHSGFGDVYPQGIYTLLKEVIERYPKKRVFISEFGFADKADTKRPFWILETVRYVFELLIQFPNAPIKGMLHWTLFNNFEWAEGPNAQFGLFSEKQLNLPLQYSPLGKISGWEAWKAVSEAVQHPSRETLLTLQSCYEIAERQFKTALSLK